jgi:hypothetical protein
MFSITANGVYSAKAAYEFFLSVQLTLLIMKEYVTPRSPQVLFRSLVSGT